MAGAGDLAPATDLGIQIAWDDKQVVTWHNNQLDLLAARRAGTLTDTTRAPLGVLGYRVDVADVTPPSPGGVPPPPNWQSLTSITTQLPAPLGTFTGELAIEPAPTGPSSTAGSDAWLPRYFANWRGGSLCEPDATPTAMVEGQGGLAAVAEGVGAHDTALLRSHLRLPGPAVRPQQRWPPAGRRPGRRPTECRRCPDIPRVGAPQSANRAAEPARAAGPGGAR